MQLFFIRSLMIQIFTRLKSGRKQFDLNPIIGINFNIMLDEGIAIIFNVFYNVKSKALTIRGLNLFDDWADFTDWVDYSYWIGGNINPTPSIIVVEAAKYEHLKNINQIFNNLNLILFTIVLILIILILIQKFFFNKKMNNKKNKINNKKNKE